MTFPSLFHVISVLHSLTTKSATVASVAGLRVLSPTLWRVRTSFLAGWEALLAQDHTAWEFLGWWRPHFIHWPPSLPLLLALGTLLLVSSVGLLLPGVGSCPMKCLCHPSSNSVDCSGQGLSKVPPDLPPWTVTLLLQDNRIHWLPALAFQSVSLLSTLNLSNNSLSNLAAEAFYGLPHLRVLNVTQNSLLSIESSFAHALPGLRELDLSSNSLRILPTSLGKPWENLTVFAVQQNHLLHLDRELLEAMPKVRLVLLKDNPWICDCHLLGLKLWLERFTFQG